VGAVVFNDFPAAAGFRVTGITVHPYGLIVTHGRAFIAVVCGIVRAISHLRAAVVFAAHGGKSAVVVMLTACAVSEAIIDAAIVPAFIVAATEHHIGFKRFPAHIMHLLP
jgi:hypothetical protein